MALNFDKYAQEGNLFMKNLAKSLGHPDEIGRTGIILRAVLHTLRERITISESLNMISQLPMFMKAIYVDNWKYREKPLKINKKEEFAEEVEHHQSQYGEQEFNWGKSTEDIIKIVFRELGTYITKGEFEDITAQMPKELKELFSESIHK
ncbi:MAG: DUF2267 domain-containing protein [Cyclobacteriaceae bacterium]